MDPITAIVFATTVALGVPSNRPLGAARANQPSTEYILDRRNAAPVETQLSGFNEPVFAELLSYKTLSDGWDGESSIAPSNSDIEAALEFVEMARDYLSAPTAMLSPDGQVGLYWNTPLAYVDINFDSNGTVSIYTRTRSDVPNDEKYLDNLDPHDVRNLLPIMDVLKPMELAA